MGLFCLLPAPNLEVYTYVLHALSRNSRWEERYGLMAARIDVVGQYQHRHLNDCYFLSTEEMRGDDNTKRKKSALKSPGEIGARVESHLTSVH